MNMILHDGTQIPIIDGSYTGTVILILEDRKALMDIWDQLTRDNLKEVKITHDDGTLIRTMHNLSLEGIQTVNNPEGTITAHFYLQETETGNVTTDAEYIQAAKILLGEEV